MKKLTCILAILTCVLSFSSCGSNDSSKPQVSTSTTTTTAINDTADVPSTTAPETEVTTTITEAKTEATKATETTAATSNITAVETSESIITEPLISAKNSMEYAQKINELISITDIDEKYGFVIGAKDGCSFHYNDLSFELYSFPENSPKLEEAKKGTFSFTIEGFGDFTMTSKVNGNFVLMYNDEDNNVIDAFYSVN